jgi:hypothetical protein
MDIRGSFVFLIGDPSLDFEDIEKNLPIIPTDIVKKGDLRKLRKNHKNPYDIWKYEIKIRDRENIFDDLLELLELLTPYSEYIKRISGIYKRVVINCYLRTEYGQIGLEMYNELFHKLADLGLQLDFHILSYGYVKD